jgi:hypothetical protein
MGIDTDKKLEIALAHLRFLIIEYEAGDSGYLMMEMASAKEFLKGLERTYD